ncbi:DUF7848 domain-containing protein [Streptomyces noursei]|uniref:DUF7848 domain-containing protein n=1 Tax=Streptomyces noursei TaxID=1971 RepID=UPI0040400CD5
MPDAADADAPVRDSARGCYRFREYHVTTTPDPLALPAFTALCVIGEERNCGATSGTLHTPDELTRWIAEHCATTGHELYEQTTRAILRAEPGAWQQGPRASQPRQQQHDVTPTPLTAVATATPTDSHAQSRTPAEPKTAVDLRIRR